MFREVPVHEVREVLRLWVRGESKRAPARVAGVNRKTVDRYVAAGVEVGLVQDGDESQISDGLIGGVCERVRPHRVEGHGEAWAVLVAHKGRLERWLCEEDLTVVKAHELLGRMGVD